MHVRTAVRYRLEKPPRATLFVQNHEEHGIELTDVSLTGCGFEGMRLDALEIGARVRLRMPDREDQLRWGRVRHVSRVAKGRGRLRCGMQFEQPLQPKVEDTGNPYWVGVRRKLARTEQDVAKARRLAAQAPDIREHLVEEILQEIREDRYCVTGADVAPKMIQEHLLGAPW